jgi:hypothetical protein
MAKQFQLDTAINSLLHEVSEKGTLTSEDSRELKSHLNDSVHQLIHKGLTEEEAFEVAKMRLGNKEELAHEFEKVNGTSLVNKEWVFIFIGIGFSIIIGNLLKFLQVIISYMHKSGKISSSVGTIFVSIPYLLLIFLVVYIFKNGEKLVVFFKERFFTLNSFAIFLIAAITGLLSFASIEVFLPPSFREGTFTLLYQIIRKNRLSEMIILGTIPVTIGLAFYFSVQSVYQKTGWHTLFKTNNYGHILLLSFGIEIAASVLSRGLFINAWFGPIISGTVIFSALLAFIYYNKNQPKLWLKTFLFALFPLLVEIIESIRRGEGNWVNSPLFYYAIGTIVSIALGFLIGFQRLKNENNT